MVAQPFQHSGQLEQPGAATAACFGGGQQRQAGCGEIGPQHGIERDVATLNIENGFGCDAADVVGEAA